MVFDEWRNGIPTAYFFTSRSKQDDLKNVLQALKLKVQAVKADWEPSSIIVDNAQAEINVLE